MFLLHVLLPLSLSSHPCPLAVPSSLAPGTHLPARSWRSRSVGPDLFPTHPPEVSALPCPPSSLLDKQTAWQPGRKGSYHRLGEAACLQLASGPSLPHPAIPRHLTAVPELGPLSLLGEACLPPAPSLQEDCGSETWSSGADDHSQREPWLGWPGCRFGCDCADTCACTPTPPSVPERNSFPAQPSGSVGRARPPVRGSLLERDSRDASVRCCRARFACQVMGKWPLGPSPAHLPMAPPWTTLTWVCGG